MWVLEFRYGFCCILLIVIVHVGRFTPQNWFCLKTVVSGMRNGTAPFRQDVTCLKGAPFSQETLVLQGHLSKSLINEIEYGLSPSCDFHLRHRYYLGIYMHACLSAEVDILLGFFFFFALDNGKRFFQLAKINTHFIFELLGKERKKVLECIFFEVAVVPVHLWFTWDFHTAFNLYSILVFYYSGRALENSPWLAIIGHLTNGVWF